MSTKTTISSEKASPEAACAVVQTAPRVSLHSVILAVAAAQFMLPFMMSGAGPLLPAIGRDLHASAMELSLINAVYTLSLSIFHLLAGRIGDMIGRKRLFLGGLTIFVIMSAVLPFIPVMPLFLVCRFIQAMGTAMMNTSALAILASCAPPAQLGKVLGLASIGMYGGLSLGPGIAGIIATAFGWRYLFFFVVPIGILAWLLVAFSIRCDWKDAPEDGFDWTGGALYILAICGLTIGSIWILEGLWAIGLFGGGAVLLVLFLRSELRAKHPILDVRFLAGNRAFCLSTLASFINYSSIFGVMFYFSLYLQGVHGLSVLETGLLISIQPAMQVFLAPLGGRLGDRHGSAIMATLGISICGCGLLIAALLDGQSSLGLIVLTQVVIGTGVALFVSPNTSAIMGSVDAAHMGQASGLVGTARTLGMLVSMVIISLTMNTLLGEEPLGPTNVEAFLKAMHLNFLFFGVLNLLGIFCSFSRIRIQSS